MLNPPIELHQSLLCLLVRRCTEEERAREQVMAQLLLPQAAWGHCYCQAPTQRENQELVTREFPAHSWPPLLRRSCHIGFSLPSEKAIQSNDNICKDRCQLLYRKGSFRYLEVNVVVLALFLGTNSTDIPF